MKGINEKHKKCVKNNQNGITLIALIVTIIVLLILAGISINMLTDENGIIAQATSAKETSKKGEIKEDIQLSLVDAKTRYYGNVEGKLEEHMAGTLSNYTTSSGAILNFNGEDEVIYTTKTGEKYLVIVNIATGEVGDPTILQDTTNQMFNSKHPEKHIPTGFYHKEGTVNTGYVITDGTNEFVWIPVASPAEYVKTLGTNNWYVKAGSTGTDTATSLGNDVTKAEQGDILGVTEILGQTVATSTTEMIEQPEAAVVNKAGGFWVGRYEAGTKSNVASNTINWNTEEIVVAQGAQPARKISQTTALSRANSWKGEAANEEKGTVAFKSGLITGTQWDVMCSFIDWNTCNSNCTSWGNYVNAVSSPYIGWHSPSGSDDWIEETTAVTKLGNSSYRWVFPTGKFVSNSNKTTAKKNIYDVAGNVWEWTTEVPCYSTGNRVLRGGSANIDGGNGLATSRHGLFGAGVTSWGIGFRLVLYVE